MFAHSCAFVFFHHLKNNDAALEQRGRHSTTHRLNEERRGDETSSFISCRRDNETRKKKSVAFVQLFLLGRRHGRPPSAAEKERGRVVMTCNYHAAVHAAALIHGAARIRGARPLEHKAGSRRRGFARSAGVPMTKDFLPAFGEFPKVCLTKMSIKEC